MNVTVRLADADRDARSVAGIYAEAVTGGVATFEEVPPDAAEMRRRIGTTLERTPWLVAELDGEVIGYAYAAPHHARPGYRWSVNLSAYVAAGHRGRGVGKRLYLRLVEILRRQGMVNAYAGVTLPNPGSERLHAAIGMRRVAVYRRIGFKHGDWHDVAWYELRLADPAGRPAEPTPVSDLAVDPVDAASTSA
jgi:phosphinothricin acetyltransferase